jgi:hypothetical protein
MELLNGRRKYCELLLHGRRPADSSRPGRPVLHGRRRPAFPRRTPPHALRAAFRLTPVTASSGPRVPVDSSYRRFRPPRSRRSRSPTAPPAPCPSPPPPLFGCVACCCSSPALSWPSPPGTCPPKRWGSSRLERRPRRLGPVALRGATARSSGAEQRASSARGGYTAQQGGWAWEVATAAGLVRVTSWSCVAAGRRDVEMGEMEIG